MKGNDVIPQTIKRDEVVPQALIFVAIVVAMIALS